MTTATTRKQHVYNVLKEARSGRLDIGGGYQEMTKGGWVSGARIKAMCGSNALRRLRELRSEGYQISVRRLNGAHYYRLDRVKPVAS